MASHFKFGVEKQGRHLDRNLINQEPGKSWERNLFDYSAAEGRHIFRMDKPAFVKVFPFCMLSSRGS